MYGSPSRLALALLAALVPLSWLLPGTVPSYYLYLANTLLMYVVLAVGLDLLLGRAGQFAFAHPAFFGIGCYGTALLYIRFGIPFAIGMPIAALVAGLVGVLIAIPATRLRDVYLALSTFAFAQGAQWVFNNWTSVTNGSDGLRMPSPSVFGWTIGNDEQAFPVIVTITVLVLAATMYLLTSRLGRAITAVRESEHVAMASGIPVRATKIVTFALSAVYAGIAGGLFTLYHAYVNPEQFGFVQVVLVLTMIVVGGLGTLPGVLIGVLVLGLLPEVLRTALRSLLVWQELVYGAILILCMMFMPRGVWGLIRRRRGRQPA